MLGDEFGDRDVAGRGQRLVDHCPDYGGGRPHKFGPDTRAEIARIALTRPKAVGKPYTRWSLTKLAKYLVEAGVVEDISVESIRRILDEEGVSYQRLKTWKESNDPHYEVKKDPMWTLVHDPPPGCRVISIDEFGPITCEPQPGRGWARRNHPRRRRGHDHKPHGAAYWLGCYDLDTDQLSATSRFSSLPDGPGGSVMVLPYSNSAIISAAREAPSVSTSR